MLLLLSENGEETGVIQSMLREQCVSFMRYCPALPEAEVGASDNAGADVLTEEELCRTLRENRIRGVVDLLSEPYASDSLLVIDTCEAQAVPYLKYIYFPPEERTYMQVCSTYKAAAKRIDAETGNVLCYAAPQTVNALAKLVAERSRLYVPIRKEATFHVGRAVQYGIPLKNIIERQVPDGYDTVKALLVSYDISCILADGSVSLTEKLPAVADRKISVLRVHRYGIEFPRVATSADEVLAFVRETDRLL